MSLPRLLLVDDEPAFLRLAAAWLEKQGWQVETATSAAEARTAFARRQPDLVLLDLVMPPERTPQAGLALIPEFAAVPVVVLTAHADHALAVQAVAAGAWDFLAKPVEPELLRIITSRALGKRALEREVAELRAAQTASAADGITDRIFGGSPAILRLKEMIRRIGPASLPVLILGPSGTGKELVAQALHTASPRRNAPFMAVHCGAIPPDLLESELFGHLKGSFTGAHQDRQGLIAAAHGGTLFLDEVAEMLPVLQMKLLRFLQEGSFMPIGSRELRRAEVRIVSATHRDPETMIAAGSLREDFYYRLKGMILRTPPLADRSEDIVPLAVRFLQEASPARPLRFSRPALDWLTAQTWPGNVRELKAAIICAAALCDPDGNGILEAEDLEFARRGEAPPPPAVRISAAAISETGPEGDTSPDGSLPAAIERLERRMIGAALSASGQNHSAAARALGLSRVGLLKMMTRLGLR